jgi:acyl-coenzyme A synthetase/AMP-(fatty) acid ligase
VTSSEVVRPEAWRLTEQMFGARLHDYYGQAERIAFAYATAPREYRFSCAYSFVEFVPYDGQVLPPHAPAPPLRGDRYFVLEQRAAHGALPHR